MEGSGSTSRAQGDSELIPVAARRSVRRNPHFRKSSIMLASNQGNEQGSKFPNTGQQPCKRAVQPGLLLRKEQQPWSCPQCVTDCASEADRKHSGSVNKLLGLVNLSIGNKRNVCTVMTAEVALSAWLVAKVIAQGDRFAALWCLKIVVISGCYPLLTSPFCLKILSL